MTLHTSHCSNNQPACVLFTLIKAYLSDELNNGVDSLIKNSLCEAQGVMCLNFYFCFSLHLQADFHSVSYFNYCSFSCCTVDGSIVLIMLTEVYAANNSQRKKVVWKFPTLKKLFMWDTWNKIKCQRNHIHCSYHLIFNLKAANHLFHYKMIF